MQKCPTNNATREVRSPVLKNNLINIHSIDKASHWDSQSGSQGIRHGHRNLLHGQQNVWIIEFQV